MYYWPIPYKIELEVNSQISKHQLKPVFVDSFTSKVSENTGCYASVLGFQFFLGLGRDSAKEKQIVTRVMTKCDTHDILSWNFFFQIRFFPKILVQCCWQVFYEGK